MPLRIARADCLSSALMRPPHVALRGALALLPLALALALGSGCKRLERGTANNRQAETPAEPAAPAATATVPPAFTGNVTAGAASPTSPTSPTTAATTAAGDDDAPIPLTSDGSDPLVGKPARAIEGKPIGGGDSVSLSSLKGRVVVVVFFATWSPPGLERVAAVQKMLVKYKAKKLSALDVAVDDDAADVTAFFAKPKNKTDATVLWDSAKKNQKAWRDAPPPSTFLVDRAGVVRKGWRVIRDGLDKDIEKELAKLL